MKPEAGVPERERAAFVATLRELKSRKVKVEWLPVLVLNASGADQAQASDFLREVEAHCRELGVDLARGDSYFYRLSELSPGKMLAAHAAAILEKSPAWLKAGERRIALASSELRLVVDGDRWTLGAQDWLQSKPFLVTSFSPGSRSGKANSRVAAELCAATRRHFASRVASRLWRELPRLAGAERSERDAKILVQAGSAADVRPWRALARDFDLLVKATPFQVPVDREASRNPLFHAPLDLRLGTGDLRRSGFRALRIEGYLDAIELKTKGRCRQARLGRGEAFRSPPRDFIRDRYGNVILPIPGIDERTGRDRFLGFEILPRLPLAKRAEPGLKTRKLGVDLRRFGLGDHPDLFEMPVLTPLLAPDRAQPYALFSSIADLSPQRAARLRERIAAGLAQSERAFGFSPGERIENIVLVRSDRKNASVRLANPETVFIWEAMLGEIERGEGAHVIAHEAWHGLDFQFHFSTYPEFLEMYERLALAQDDALFAFINEHRFLGKDGGHAADDVLEFFASLMNTIDAPDWDAKLRDADPRVRGLYFRALEAVAQSFQDRRPQVLESPMGQLMKSRIEALRKMFAGKPPALDGLVQIPVSARLEALGVAVLGGHDLKRALRDRRQALLLYVYDERDRESLAAVNRAFEKFKGQARLVAIRYRDLTASDLMSSHFGSRLSAPALYLFKRGKEVYRGEIWDTKKHQNVLEAIAGALR